MHTPGPWRYVQSRTQVWSKSVGGCHLEEANHLIADVRGWGHLKYLPNGADVQDANGRLIAAAPDLLEALREAEFVMDDCPMVSPALVAAIKKARAAIAKAKGDKT